jgi:hypothetical protein
MSTISVSFVDYIMNDVLINDPDALKRFLVTYLPFEKQFYDALYDAEARVLIVRTKEPAFSEETNILVRNLVLDKFPNPQVSSTAPVPRTAESDTITSSSVYGYFPKAMASDGDVVLGKNISLTRNMYYRNLIISPGVTLNTNGWRIVVTEHLVLNGTISHNGTDAIGATPGTGTAAIYTTYLGSGSDGGAGLTTNGTGKSGIAAAYQCAGGKGGNGGRGYTIYVEGSAGSFMPISAVDGGLNMLATMPVAFLGRLISEKSYIMGGTGGGSGGAMRLSAKTVRSGAGGGGGGLIVLAAKSITGTGKIEARGGNGSDAGYTGTFLPHAGGGGGGGGGCIIVVSQFGMSGKIEISVSGGTGGLGVGEGTPGSKGADGNIFTLQI